MNTTTLLLDSATIAKLIHFYQHGSRNPSSPYIQFTAKVDNCTITVYLSKKVVFQGNNHQIEASRWTKKLPTPVAPKGKEKKVGIIPTLPQAGSDEVGTGDYFGPVCVCAAYVDEEKFTSLLAYEINDSKKITDAYIMKIAPKIMEILPHSLLILPNDKYNTIHETTNLNAIKAILHNQAYLHLQEKVPSMPSLAVVDQFAEESLYFHYLKKEATIYRNLHFETKAESHYIAVAAASMIARYAFLHYMEQLNESFSFEFPKGAGKNVDIAIKQFVSKHGRDELHKVAKLHFKNTSVLD